VRPPAVLLALVAAVLLAAPAHALPVAPPAVKSDNVTWLGSLDEPNVISARFRDGIMYVSTLRGISTYDVSDPATPRRLGSLPLPHFENEDVDVGGDVLLVSNDPSEGKGRLYVVSIADPANPHVISELDTGYVDAGQGIMLGFLGAQGLNPLPAGTGHTASCIDDCRYAYLAGTAAGIDVVDLRDPAHPEIVKNVPVPEATGGVATHDVQVDDRGLAWIAGYGGTAAYDVRDPLNPRLVHETGPEGEGHYVDDVASGSPSDGSTLNDFIHHNSLRRGRTVFITEEDYTRPTCDGAGSFQSWRIGRDGVLRNLDAWSVETDATKGVVFCSAHYFDERAGLVAQGFYEQGTRFLDVSDPADIRQVGYWIPRANETWGAVYPPTDRSGEIVYALDEARGIDVLRVDRPGTKAKDLRKMPTVVAPPTVRPPDEQAQALTASAAFGGLCRLLGERIVADR
jgi:hypothetical protein